MALSRLCRRTGPTGARASRGQTGSGATRSATAVGVEDEATWAQLAEIGFSSAQGYLIAAPMPPSQLSEWRAARV